MLLTALCGELSRSILAPSPNSFQNRDLSSQKMGGMPKFETQSVKKGLRRGPKQDKYTFCFVIMSSRCTDIVLYTIYNI